uniref:MMS19 nucleotide excision repair protein n=1 Tax=Caenorhabditis tropicalis TaxID=1561998 RepID=A0A1I7TVM2_9PELO
MFVDSLLNLSSKIVAKCLAEGRYKHLDIDLNPSLSDQVFSEVVKLPSISSNPLKEDTGLKLNLTKFETDALPVFGEDLANLHRHDIRSLAITLVEFLDDFKYEPKEDEDEEDMQLDIVRVLKTCLNEKSCQNLEHLSSNLFECFPDGWAELVDELLPNLISFAPVGLYNLTGIGHLRNLQILTLEGSSAYSNYDVEPVLELPNLRVLIVIYCKSFMTTMSHCNGTLQNLRFLEFYGSEITEEQLRQLVARHPSLETIAFLDTPCDETDFSDLPITVFNLATIQSTMTILSYILDRIFGDSNEWHVETSIDRLGELLETETIQGFKEDEFLKLMMEVTLKVSDEENSQVATCLIPYFQRIFPYQSMTEILRKLHPKSPLFVERRWAAQTVLRYFPDPVRF